MTVILSISVLQGLRLNPRTTHPTAQKTHVLHTDQARQALGESRLLHCPKHLRAGFDEQTRCPACDPRYRHAPPQIDEMQLVMGVDENIGVTELP
ncbi:hypothetical protein D3C79_855910 [compost metagenome]